MPGRGKLLRTAACAAALALCAGPAAAGFLAPYDDVLVSAPEGTYFLTRDAKGFTLLPGGAERFAPIRRAGVVNFPMPLQGAVVGNFGGDGMDDLLLTHAPGGPYLLVSQGGFFIFEHRTIVDRESPRNFGQTRLAGLRGSKAVSLPLPFADALAGDFAGSPLDDLILPHARGAPLLLENKGDRFEPARLDFGGADLRYALDFTPFRNGKDPPASPFPAAHALSGDFAGDARDDLILLAAEGGPRLLVRKDGAFALDPGGDLRETRLAAAVHAGVTVRALIENAVAGNFAGDGRDDLLVVVEDLVVLLVNEGERFAPSRDAALRAPVGDLLKRRLAVAGEFVVALE